MEKKRAGFTISAVAEMYGIHPQTLRAYEREGLLHPERSRGNTRLYTQENLERLDLILTLTRELGVNLAGVAIILDMREKMERMQAEVEEFVQYVSSQFDLDPDIFRGRVREALVRVPPSHIVTVSPKPRR